MPITISDSSSAVSNSQIAATLPHIRDVVVDNVKENNVLLSFLMGGMGDDFRERAFGEISTALPGTITGGRDFHVPVRLTTNPTPASYSGYDKISLQAVDADRYALFPIRQSAGSLVISGRERRGNKGQAAIYNLLSSKASGLMNSLREELTRQVLSDGTGNGGKDVEGFAAVFGTGTLAGLNPSTHTSWQPGGFASGNSRHAITTGAGSWSSNNLDQTLKDYIKYVSWDSRPDAIFSASDAQTFYEATIDGQIRYMTTEVGDQKFKHLDFAGVPWFFDLQIADGTLYVLNSRHIMFARDVEGDFVFIDEGVRPADQDAFTRLMVVEGNIITDSRRSLATIQGITA